MIGASAPSFGVFKMKKFINGLAFIGALSLLFAGVGAVLADADECMGLGLPGPLAEAICATPSVTTLAVSGAATVGGTLGVTGALTTAAGIDMGTSQTLDGTTSILVDVGGSTDLTIADNTITIADGTALKVGNAVGWTNVDAANQACSTTCGVSDCIIGTDGTNFVTCADATADSCLCDGAAS